MKQKTLLSEIVQLNEFGTAFGAYTATQLSVVPNDATEEEAEETPKIDLARSLFQGLAGNSDKSRAEIITAFEQQLNVSHSTAVSYYQRLAKEAGLTNAGDAGGGSGGMVAPTSSNQSSNTSTQSDDSEQQYDPELELPDEELDIYDEVPESDDPDKQGVIRVVANAHLVYKRENEEGTYDELWAYNTSSSLKNELEIHRAILAGTDIPPTKTKSEDGSQSFTLSTMGNAQLLFISNLPQ